MRLGGYADEPVADAEGCDQLGRARVERDDALRGLLENGGLVAVPLDGDRIRLLEVSDRL